MHNLIIIGEKFRQFKDNKSVYSIDDYKDKVADALSIKKIIFGQGLTSQEIERVKQDFLTKNSAIIFSKESTLVPNNKVHKVKSENNLISDFNKKSENNFTSEVVIHPDNEMISDHVTGIHIPGMLLIEAARQFVIASLEHEQYTNVRFILNSIESEFKSYAFPLPVSLVGEVNVVKNKLDHAVNAKVIVTQGNRICMEIKLSATLINEKVAKFNETMNKNIYLKQITKENITDETENKLCVF